MSDAITVALVGLAGSSVGSLAGIVVSSKLTQYRLEQVEKKLDGFLETHRGLERRVTDVEKQVQLHDERLKVANHRIDDLERRGEA